METLHKETKASKALIDAAIEKARSCINKDNHALKLGIDELYQASKSTASDYGYAYAYWLHGVLQAHSNDQEGAMKLFQQSLALAKSQNNQKLIGSNYATIASICMMRGDLSQAIDYHNKNKEISEKLGDDVAIGVTYSNLATIYGKYLNDIEQSLAFCLLAEKKYLDAKAEDRLAGVYINISNCYMLQEKYEDAEKYANLVVHYASREQNQYFLAGAYQTLATLHLRLRNFELVQTHLLACKDCYAQANIQYNNLGIAFLTAELSYEKGDIETALTQYLEILETYQAADDVSITIDVLKRLSSIYASKAMFEEAFQQQEQILLLKDTLFQKETNNALQRQKVIFQTEKLENEYHLKLMKSEMDTLRAQMNPHFIFNSLSSINRYILKNETDEASDYLVKFSQLIRTVLDNARSETVSLYDELATLKLYIDIEALRFGNKIKYVFDVEDEAYLHDIELPPLLLQPYVENAIWHGLMLKESEGLLSIRTFRDGEAFVLTIEDNGIGREKAKALKSKSNSSHVSHGMKVTADRINLYNESNSRKMSVHIIDLMEAEKACGTKIVFSFEQPFNQSL